MYRLLQSLVAICLIATPLVPALEAKEETSLTIIDRLVVTGFERGRSEPVDTIVLHSVFAQGKADPYAVDEVIALFARYQVSTHYLIDREGNVYRLVGERDTSYHAGKSRMPEPDGRDGVNSFSVGIELIGGHDDVFTEAQYLSLEVLLRDIKTRHNIKHVVGHGEITPERRSDPWNFDWTRMWRWIENW